MTHFPKLGSSPMSSEVHAWFKLGSTVGRSDFFPPGKFGRSDSQLGEVIAQNYKIFCQFRSIAITNTTAIKWQEKYDSVVADCHHSLRCVVTE